MRKNTGDDVRSAIQGPSQIGTGTGSSPHRPRPVCHIVSSHKAYIGRSNSVRYFEGDLSHGRAEAIVPDRKFDHETQKTERDERSL